MEKIYALFNNDGIMIQTMVSINGEERESPWVILPEQLHHVRLPIGLADNGSFVVGELGLHKFNKQLGKWEIDIAIKKQELLNLIQNAFSLNNRSNVLFRGNPYNADQVAEANVASWQIQANLVGLPDGFQWRDANNIFQNADVDFLNGLALAIANKKTDNYKILWKHKEAVNAIQTQEEAAYYDINTGWSVPLPKVF